MAPQPLGLSAATIKAAESEAEDPDMLKWRYEMSIFNGPRVPKSEREKSICRWLEEGLDIAVIATRLHMKTHHLQQWLEKDEALQIKIKAAEERHRAKQEWHARNSYVDIHGTVHFGTRPPPPPDVDELQRKIFAARNRPPSQPPKSPVKKPHPDATVWYIKLPEDDPPPRAVDGQTQSDWNPLDW